MSDVVSVPSVAVNRSTCGPACVKVASVEGCAALANVTGPPLSTVHTDVTLDPEGRPSSLTVPNSGAGVGSVTV